MIARILVEDHLRVFSGCRFSLQSQGLPGTLGTNSHHRPPEDIVDTRAHPSPVRSYDALDLRSVTIYSRRERRISHHFSFFPLLVLCLPLVAIPLVVVGCAGSPEQIVLDRFFAASRLRDLTQLHTLATVVFEPRERGTVLELKVRAITRQPLRSAKGPSDREVVAMSSGGVAGADGRSGEQDGMEIEAEQVTAEALVRNPAGQVKTTTLVVQLERAIRTGHPEVGRHWVVTEIRSR